MIVAAGALFVDEHDRVMLVQPSYKPTWDIPGGVVEAGETPIQACAREVAEELGLTIEVGRLLVADWAPQNGDRLLFVFDGGRLSAEQLDAIRFVDGEITAWEFVELSRLDDYVNPRLARRLLAIRPGETRYLEHGVDPLP
jgi:ADP-ribose pyrophosphatase YjhB (NUDIX family)